MEPHFWTRFVHFVKSSFQEKFKAFMPGCVMGFIGCKHFLWAGSALSLVEYTGKYIGTVVMAFSSGLATAYASYIVDQYKKKKDGKSKQSKRQKGKAA